MHRLYELKDKLLNELMAQNEKPLSPSTIEYIDVLTHELKNLCKIIESKENEYSGRGNYNNGSSYRGNYNGTYDGGYDGTFTGMFGGNSYARGGSNMNHGSMSSYNSNGYSGKSSMDDIVREFRNMADRLPADSQEEAKRLIMKMEQL